MIRIITFLMLIQIANHINAQSNHDLDFIILEGQDTTFCIITEIVRSGGNVYKIEYFDLEKQKHSIGKKEIKNVKSMRVAGRTLDYIPLKASKPDSYQRHIERKIDGEIKIYDHIRLSVKTEDDGKRQLYSVVGSGAVIYNIKLPDGNYYKINSINLKKVIVPYMMKCKEFKNSFKETISTNNIENAVMKFNEVCK